VGVGVGVAAGCDGEGVGVGVVAGGGVGAGVVAGGDGEGVGVGVAAGGEGPPDCVARRAIATTATIATVAIIIRFLFGMGRGWLYGKNLFAMFNVGYIDAARHSLRQNSYECLVLLWWEVVSIGVLLCLSKTPHRRLFRRRLAIENDAKARRSGRGRSSGFASCHRVAGDGFRLRGHNDSGGNMLVGEG